MKKKQNSAILRLERLIASEEILEVVVRNTYQKDKYDNLFDPQFQILVRYSHPQQIKTFAICNQFLTGAINVAAQKAKELSE